MFGIRTKKIVRSECKNGIIPNFIDISHFTDIIHAISIIKQSLNNLARYKFAKKCYKIKIVNVSIICNQVANYRGGFIIDLQNISNFSTENLSKSGVLNCNSPFSQ